MIKIILQADVERFKDNCVHLTVECDESYVGYLPIFFDLVKKAKECVE